MDNVIEYGSFLSIEFSKICGSFVNAFQGNFVVVIISFLVRGRFFIIIIIRYIIITYFSQKYKGLTR